MKQFNDYLEAAKDSSAAKDAWWDKNYQALIDWVADNTEDALDIYARGKAMREAEYDATAKHQALGVLDKLSIAALDELIGGEEDEWGRNIEVAEKWYKKNEAKITKWVRANPMKATTAIEKADPGMREYRAKFQKDPRDLGYHLIHKIMLPKIKILMGIK